MHHCFKDMSFVSLGDIMKVRVEICGLLLFTVVFGELSEDQNPSQLLMWVFEMCLGMSSKLSPELTPSLVKNVLSWHSCLFLNVTRKERESCLFETVSVCAAVIKVQSLTLKLQPGNPEATHKRAFIFLQGLDLLFPDSFNTLNHHFDVTNIQNKLVHQANKENKMNYGPKVSISMKLANFIALGDNKWLIWPHKCLQDSFYSCTSKV